VHGIVGNDKSGRWLCQGESTQRSSRVTKHPYAIAKGFKNQGNELEQHGLIVDGEHELP
jgi:hypothetical protein